VQIELSSIAVQQLTFDCELASTTDDLELNATPPLSVVTTAQVGHRFDAPLVNVHVTCCNTANITSQLKQVNSVRTGSEHSGSTCFRLPTYDAFRVVHATKS